MTIVDLAGAWLVTQLLNRVFGPKDKPAQPRPTAPTAPRPPVVVMPVPVPATPTATPKPPAAAPPTPSDIKWPAHAGIPGADAVVVPTPPPAPGAAPPKPPPPPPIVDEKQPGMQKGGGAASSAAQKGIDAMKTQQDKGTGTGTRQFRPKRKGLTGKEVARAKELLGGWELGKVWRSADDPSTIYKAAKHGTKKAIEVWTSNPDFW